MGNDVNERAEDVIEALRDEVPCQGGCGTLVTVVDVQERTGCCEECLWYAQMQSEYEAEEARAAYQRLLELEAYDDEQERATRWQ